MGTLMAARRRRFAIGVPQSIALTVVLALCGVAGAKLLYAFENGFRWDGVSFYGAVWLVLVLMPLVGLIFGLRPSATLDLCAPCVTAMVTCLRFNCLLAGCCGGWLAKVGGVSFRWPTQMIESLGDLLILFFLLVQEQKGQQKGRLYPLFLCLYGTMRFFIEFLRDTPKELLLSNGQWFSLVSLAVGGIWLYGKRREKTKTR